MGIKERQERDREAVRRSILDAARDLFVSEGYQNVSIRKIAERIEYSPAALYSYFPSKDDIFFALAEEGFRLLHGAAGVAEVDGLPPLERVRRIFWGFYRFSVEQPQYFALMFVDREVPRVSREYERFTFAQQTKHRIIAHLQHAIDAGLIPRSVPAPLAARMLTTGLLGVAVLRLSDRLAPGENGDDLARAVLDTTLAGLRSGVTFASPSTSSSCALEEQ
jgi:AcrR family transcriptional regulator